MTIMFHNLPIHCVGTSIVSALICFALHQSLAGGRTSLALALAIAFVLLCFTAEPTSSFPAFNNPSIFQMSL